MQRTYFLIFILYVPFFLNAQLENPIDAVQFYSLKELNIEQQINQNRYVGYYNKVYDPATFKQQFFAPWTFDWYKQVEIIKASQDFTNSFHYQGHSGTSPCFRGNLNAFDLDFIKSINENTIKSTFPNIKKTAITVNYAELRELPTEEFCLKRIRNAGEGYPFDYFQLTSLWIGTPLAVFQESKDKQWYFVVSPYSSGWIKAQSIAFISSQTIKKVLKSQLAAVTKDKANIQLYSNSHNLRIGSILPTAGLPDDKGMTLLVPQKGKHNKVNFQKIRISFDLAKPFPLTFNAEHIELILNELIGGKYSWGGIDGGRDCSSTIKDFLSPFGIWMPRNSKQQKEIGQKIPIEGDIREKIGKIISLGVPFLSVVYKPGHSMLYVGKSKEGNPLVFHNVWGIKPIFEDDQLFQIAQKRDAYGLFGLSPNVDNGTVNARFIIGRAVITSTNPEERMKDLKFNSFMENINSINIFIK